MNSPLQKETRASDWAQGLGQVAEMAAKAREEELMLAMRACQEALIEEDRPEILEQFERVVVLCAKGQSWHEGLTTAREVNEAVTRWSGFDVRPYALTVAQFAHNYGIQLLQARLFGSAEEAFSDALRFFQIHGDSARAQVSAHQLGRSQQAQEKYEEAEQSFGVSLEIARGRSDKAYIARNLFQLGQIAQLTGKQELCASLYQEVLDHAESISSKPLGAAAAHQLGILAQTRGEYREAEVWFERALEEARANDDAHAMADALHQLGMVAHEQGDFGRAIHLYRASLASADETTDIGPTLYQMAQASHACGDWANAESQGRESLSVFQAQGHLAGIRRAQDLLQRMAQEREVALARRSETAMSGS